MATSNFRRLSLQLCIVYSLFWKATCVERGLRLQVIITARKFSEAHVKNSVHRGEYLGRYPARTRYTPGTRYTPQDQVPPWDQVHPSGPGTPPEPGTPPGTRYTPRDQVPPSPGPGTPLPPLPVDAGRYKWAVRILLECILISVIVLEGRLHLKKP